MPGERRRVSIDLSGPSRTKQQFKDLTDVNNIVKHHTEGAHVTHLNPRMPTYGDNSGVVDLMASIEAVHAAEESFMALPIEVRKAAKHDPVRLLEMLTNEQEAQILVDAGMPIVGLEKTPEPRREDKPAQPAAAPQQPPSEPPAPA